jgi:hypothetical protein
MRPMQELNLANALDEMVAELHSQKRRVLIDMNRCKLAGCFSTSARVNAIKALQQVEDARLEILNRILELDRT